MRLEGKSALVTGAGAGLGKAIAERFALEGAKVVVNDINPDTGQAVVDGIVNNGGTAAFIQGDTTEEADAQKMVQFAVETHGALDILVNNAGIEIVKPAHEMTKEELDKIFNVNVIGYFLVGKYAIPQLLARGGGNIINMASAAGLIGFPLASAYSATKHANVGLTRTWALELRGFNIRVNCICPSVIDTDLGNRFVEAYRAAGLPIDDILASMSGRLGTPAEVAGAALYLASDDASFINGVALPVDGATTAG